jgi:hypothetical protein
LIPRRGSPKPTKRREGEKKERKKEKRRERKEEERGIQLIMLAIVF